jgi:hypothetical protein
VAALVWMLRPRLMSGVRKDVLLLGSGQPNHPRNRYDLAPSSL